MYQPTVLLARRTVLSTKMDDVDQVDVIFEPSVTMLDRISCVPIAESDPERVELLTVMQQSVHTPQPMLRVATVVASTLKLELTLEPNETVTLLVLLLVMARLADVAAPIAILVLPMMLLVMAMVSPSIEALVA